ncbi:hypothetical protein [Zobellia barbeyronii]|uniref:EXPERA domain-containing protein n=1 Tax=Zobellia barbeyronii TaxID=2748009 RepID=A0ABS5WJI5_9FLAO|nr:hypothetical protein [Zobellia barbeyronii]MBT2163000.1 hypothetical protein [Zobellia barbeyronii]
MQQKSPDSSNKARKKIFMDSIGVLLILLSPFIFKLHQYLPSDPNATISFLGIEIDNHGFVDINTFAWFLLSKIVPFYLFILWFLTCKHWWYHIILIPATMYAFQIYEVLFSEDNIVDSKNILWLLPVCMVVIPLVYFIRLKLYDKYVHGIDLEAMEAELTALKKKEAAKSNDKKIDKFISKETSTDSSGYQSMSDKIDTKLSTDNIESSFKQFQLRFSNWLRPKF